MYAHVRRPPLNPAVCRSDRYIPRCSLCRCITPSPEWRICVRGILIPGSISVVQQLLAAGLLDELRLLVHPVAARKGRRLFDDGNAPYHLKVTATEVFPTGVIRVIYAPAGAPAKA